MPEQIISIDPQKCNGCGECVSACHESAIQIIDGVARLVFLDYCDGLGDCLPVCPTDAISFKARDVLFDNIGEQAEQAVALPVTAPGPALMNWPIQLKLAPTKSAYFHQADLLIAADCTAFAYSRFHQDYGHNHVVLIACPKLDEADYFEKLAQVFMNGPKSVTVARMQVPCCRALENATASAMDKAQLGIPLQVAVIATDGKIVG
ncbi:MAG: 4Fe-4S dicluster domain-containing protein [Coriobacteriia bacterium]|nr:4Fe-4S dicluster domain-containing protein [Coriobacteriia bacterium]